MQNWLLNKEICYQLLTKILLDREEPHGELLTLLKKKKSKNNQKICLFLKGIKQKSKVNLINIVTKFWILLIVNYFKKQFLKIMLKLKFFIINWKEIILDIFLNIHRDKIIKKQVILLMMLIRLLLKKPKKI